MCWHTEQEGASAKLSGTADIIRLSRELRRFFVLIIKCVRPIVAGVAKPVPPTHYMVKTARSMGVSFCDE